MTLVAPRVWRLKASGYAHVYLVQAQAPVLIDSGFTWNAGAIARELKAEGVEELGAILLTHHDPDHAGGAPALQKQTGAPVYAGKGDLPFFDGAAKWPAGKNVTGWLSGLGRPADLRALPEGLLGVLGVAVTPAPGHTPGHCVFQFENVIFCGDLFSSKGGRLKNMDSYHADRRQNAASLRKLLDFEADVFCPAHGDPVKNTPQVRAELRGLTEEYT